MPPLGALERTLSLRTRLVELRAESRVSKMRVGTAQALPKPADTWRPAGTAAPPHGRGRARRWPGPAPQGS